LNFRIAVYIFFILFAYQFKNMIKTTWNLNSGHIMPMVGFGTWYGSGFWGEKVIKDSIRAALDCGYRHIDTAYLYKTEQVVGEVLREYFSSKKLKREDIFVTTKIWPTFMGSKELATRGIELSLKNLGIDYIDMLIMHAPAALTYIDDDTLFPSGDICVQNRSCITDSWQVMERFVDEGKLKSIGVSNFNIEQMNRIKEIAKHPLSYIQVEYHVYLQQPELVEYCSKENIVIVAYAPLGSPGRPSNVQGWSSQAPIEDPLVNEIAKARNKSPAQILLRFLLQRNISVIPKSKTPERVRENFEILNFELTENEMKSLVDLNKNERDYSFQFIKNHVEYPF